MANTPRSRKAKGRKLQQEVREKLLASFPAIPPEDVKCALMSEAGTDIKLSALARKHIPYSIECKNTEKIAIWEAIKQSTVNATEDTEPVVIFRRNNSDTFITLRFEHFLKLIAPLDKQSQSS